MKRSGLLLALLGLAVLAPSAVLASGGHGSVEPGAFPLPLDSYGDAEMEGVWARLVHRAETEPYNVVATAIFLLAIVHTFLSSKFLAFAHKWQAEHATLVADRKAPRMSQSLRANLFHFLGEVEVVFGLWAIVLGVSMMVYFDWGTFIFYATEQVNFTEAMFVVVVMTLASTRPILRLSEAIMAQIARLLGGGLMAWWLTLLTVGPILGSFITEPAAITITALLLGRKFYELEPSNAFKYATIGLLFVNISVGGTLTHFAAPPVLMVAEPWGWDMAFMLTHFGWKTVTGIVLGNLIYLFVFRREFARLHDAFVIRQVKQEVLSTHLRQDLVLTDFEEIVFNVREELRIGEAFSEKIEEAAVAVRARLAPKYLEAVADLGVDRELAERAFQERFEELKLARLQEAIPSVLPVDQRPPFLDPAWDSREHPVPVWITVVHIVFLGLTIMNAHHPPLFITNLLFFLGFSAITAQYQNRINLRGPLLVGFFLAGLVVHGGLQGWWIEPVLGGLSETPLMISATVLTAFNDNAAITFLSTLVPGFTDELKYAVVAGAVTGGGLTVIANAPNPAGQSILSRHFEHGVSPAKLLLAALGPTVLLFLLFKFL